MNIFKTALRQLTMSNQFIPRKLATANLALEQKADKMSAWQIHSYGDVSELQLSTKTRIPPITHPNQVIVKVEAASINPIDVAMLGGYGSTALNLMRNHNIEFPLTLGRDFYGTVVSKGLGHCNRFDVGTKVWGVVPVHDQGCHAEYVSVDVNTISEAPKNLTSVEAASILYTGLTAWSGIKYSANLNLSELNGVKVLVLGASGGVGNAVVQILKAGGANVVCTCSKDAVPLVEKLGADCVLDYTSNDFSDKLMAFERFDVIIDCAALGTNFATSTKLKFKRFITFSSPVLRNMDSKGLFFGTLSTISDLVSSNVTTLKNGGIIAWAFFVPCPDGIKHISNLITTGKMIPVVEQVYSFNEMPTAFQRVKDGHLRGKIVVDFSESSDKM